jgi:hypothetical protein
VLSSKRHPASVGRVLYGASIAEHWQRCERSEPGEPSHLRDKPLSSTGPENPRETRFKLVQRGNPVNVQRPWPGVGCYRRKLNSSGLYSSGEGFHVVNSPNTTLCLRCRRSARSLLHPGNFSGDSAGGFIKRSKDDEGNEEW